MVFNPKSAKKAGEKSKRGPAKKEGPSIKEKMELLYEKVLDDLLKNQEKLTKTERVTNSFTRSVLVSFSWLTNKSSSTFS